MSKNIVSTSFTQHGPLADAALAHMRAVDSSRPSKKKIATTKAVFAKTLAKYIDSKLAENGVNLNV